MVGLSGLALAVAVGVRLTAIRAGRVTLSPRPALFSAIQEQIDWLAVVLVMACRAGLKWLTIKTLYLLHGVATRLKVIFLLIEKRFARVINLVHGRGAVGKKGAVSFFLREITENKRPVKIRSAK